MGKEKGTPGRVKRNLKRYRYIYLMLLPVILYYAVFCYTPMGGVVIAFQNFKPALGITGSKWVGLKHFTDFLTGPYAWRLIRNTLLINILQIMFAFPVPVFIALLINEIHCKAYKKVVQTVSYMADHGELMGDHGMYCKGPFHYEGLLKIPMIMAWPGHLAEGRRELELVSLLDFMPTILELAGIAYPEGRIKAWEGPYAGKKLYPGSPLLGKSLVGLMCGRESEGSDSILVEDDDDIRQVFLRTLITQEYKITVYSKRTYGELFDLRNDPEELNNLWDEKEYQKIKQEMIWKLMQKLIQNQDRTSRRIGIA